MKTITINSFVSLIYPYEAKEYFITLTSRANHVNYI